MFDIVLYLKNVIFSSLISQREVIFKFVRVVAAEKRSTLYPLKLFADLKNHNETMALFNLPMKIHRLKKTWKRL